MASAAPSLLQPRDIRVLIVSDHPDTSEMYALFLAHRGVRADSVSYAAAVARAVASPPDILTADLGLPIEVAFGVLQQLKEHPDTRGIPIVALTGHASDQLRTDAASVGCGRLLLKPVAPERVLREIYRTLRIASTKRPARRNDAQPS
jgi:two-component system cell cycle response regulator DivK